MIDIHAVGRLIDAQPIAFLGSIDAEGFPNVKAMLRPRRRDGIETVWFSTNTSSLRVAQFRADPRACVYVCDPRHFIGVQLVGTVEVVTDPEIRRELWREGDTVYYPQGVDDPDYCVLRFTALRGRHYRDHISQDFTLGGQAESGPAEA